MYDKIKHYIRGLMKDYNKADRKSEKEIVSTCYDKYKAQLSEGIKPEKAYQASISGIENILKDKIMPKNRFRYSLTFSICALIVSLVEISAAAFLAHPLDFMGFEMPVFIVVLIGTFVYTIAKYRKFYWYDYPILAIFILSWISTLLQIGGYAYHATMPDKYWNIEYGFPCIIKILTFETDTYPDVFYRLTDVSYTYCFNFLVSAIAFIVMSALIIKEKIRIKGGTK